MLTAPSSSAPRFRAAFQAPLRHDEIVDSSGTTISYTKTTVLPDGTILYTKDKVNP
jgi:hypothetical protein